MKVVATDSVVTALSVAIAVTLIMYTSLSQHCHYHYCFSAVIVSAVTIAVKLLCAFSLPQCCSFSFSQRNAFVTKELVIMKILLACKKVANANTRSRSSFSFWREFPEFVCKPGSQRLVTQFVVAPISSNQLSFSRCVLNRSFSI